MGVSKERVEAMMEIVAEEEKLKKKRIAACIPNHPCLAPEYKCPLGIWRSALGGSTPGINTPHFLDFGAGCVASLITFGGCNGAAVLAAGRTEAHLVDKLCYVCSIGRRT
eukprot:scaffold2435_cov126-Skeletonema_menzelii.AAC.1